MRWKGLGSSLVLISILFLNTDSFVLCHILASRSKTLSIRVCQTIIKGLFKHTEWSTCYKHFITILASTWIEMCCNRHVLQALNFYLFLFILKKTNDASMKRKPFNITRYLYDISVWNKQNWKFWTLDILSY